jgi:hypothetical protein
MGGPEAAAVLGRWQVEAIVVPVGRAAPGEGWDQVFADLDGSLYLRTP